MRIPQPWFREQNQTYYVQLDGKQTSLGKDKEAAYREYHRLMAKRANGVPLGDGTVRSVLDDYWTWLQANRAGETCSRRKPILVEFGKSIPANLRIRELRPFHVQRWIDKHHSTNAPTSKNNLITAIQIVMNWAFKMGYCDHNPIARMEKPAAAIRQEYVPADLWPKVLELARGQQFKDFLMVMLASGARVTEMFKFEARHLDGAKFVLPIDESKGKKRSRVVYLPNEALVIVKRLVEQYPKGKLFRNSKGVAWGRNSIKCRFRNLKIALDMPKLCATTLRHSYCHHRLTSGQSALSLSKLMGHVDTRMIASRYGHLEQDTEFMEAEANRISFPIGDVSDPPSTAPSQPA